MTVNLNIEPAVQETLTAKAQAMGVPVESLIGDVLVREATRFQTHGIERPAGPGEWMERDRTFQSAMAWLAENRERYAGKWIALQGAELIAVGDTGKEVYAQVAGQGVPPLVIRVEEEDPPFAGW